MLRFAFAARHPLKLRIRADAAMRVINLHDILQHRRIRKITVTHTGEVVFEFLEAVDIRRFKMFFTNEAQRRLPHARAADDERGKICFSVLQFNSG